MTAAAIASIWLGTRCEICVPIWWTNPWCSINQQMEEYCASSTLSLKSLLSDDTLLITNLEETAIPCSFYSNMWCSNCSLKGCRIEAHPLHITFAFLFHFSCILTMSLFQVMNCLWWRLVAQQVAGILRFWTSICIWICWIANILPVKLCPGHLCFIFFILLFLHWSLTIIYTLIVFMELTQSTHILNPSSFLLKWFLFMI